MVGRGGSQLGGERGTAAVLGLIGVQSQGEPQRTGLDQQGPTLLDRESHGIAESVHRARQIAPHDLGQHPLRHLGEVGVAAALVRLRERVEQQRGPHDAHRDPLHGPLHVHKRALPLRRLKNAGDERRFLERELLVGLVEVQPRRRLDTVRTVAEIHLIAVDREDFLFRVALLDLDRQNRFFDLPLDRFFVAETELIPQVPGELLRQSARPLRCAALNDVGDGRDEDAPDVDPEMALELGILGGNNRVAQQRIDVVVADDDAPLSGELADDRTVGGVDARDRARRVIVECRHSWQIARVGEEDTTEDPEYRRDDEQRDETRVPRNTNDNVRHKN